MIKNIVDAVRGLLYRMGLIQGIKKITDKKEIIASDDHYNEIDLWRSLYKGYHKDYHDVVDHTVSGKIKRTRATLNMPKVISSEMASLVFNEKCQINISNETLADHIKEVFDKNKFYKQFQKHLEYDFALGGLALKPYFQKDKIKISYVSADAFYPISSSNDEINEGVFAHETKKGNSKFTLLEWHIWEGEEYVILNELYESKDSSSLGTKVSLKSLYPDLTEETRIKGLTRSIFVYIKPNTANNKDIYSPLGISIFANALDTLKSLDIAFDSYQREFRLGRKRIIVPTSAIRSVVNPETGTLERYFDAEDEVYQAINLEGQEDKIQDISVELRVDEHISAINSLLNLLAMQTGFSAGTFSFDGQSVKTATEVISENSKTFRTKNSHATVVEEGIKELVDVIVDLSKLYNIFTVAGEYEVTVDFDDSIAEDRASNATYYSGLSAQGLMSKKRAIMRIFDLPEEEAQKWLEEIIAENQSMAPDLSGIDGDED